MAIFKGAAVAIVTPMHEDGKVNYEKLEELDQGGGRSRHQDRGTDRRCHHRYRCGAGRRELADGGQRQRAGGYSEPADQRGGPAGAGGVSYALRH